MRGGREDQSCSFPNHFLDVCFSGSDPGQANGVVEGAGPKGGDRRTRPKVVIIRGSGKIFCAGHDLKELATLAWPSSSELPREPQGEVEKLFRLCSEVMLGIYQSPLIFIAEVEGIATAAGCQLVSACDLAIASSQATFATPGVNIGLFCTTPSVAIGRSVLRKHAMEMLLTGKPITAKTALRIGLINRVVGMEEGEDLPSPSGRDAIGTVEEEVRKMAREIATKPGDVLSLGKRAFYEQMEKGEVSAAYEFAGGIMARNLVLPNAREGIRAFLEKRIPPNFDDS